jgi:hypothetical protein
LTNTSLSSPGLAGDPADTYREYWIAPVKPGNDIN